MFTVVFVLLFCCAVSQHVVNVDEFPKTQELIMDLYGVMGQSTALQTCIKKVASPLDKVIGFAKQVQEIDEKVSKIEQRIEVTVDIMDGVMLIPYVGQVAAAFLEPTIVVLNSIKHGLESVEPVIGHFAGLMHKWTEPLKTVKGKIDWVTKTIGNFTKIVAVVDAKASAAEGCADELPVGRSGAIHALEKVSDSLDVIPDGFNDALGHVNKGCAKVESFLSRIHVLRRRRGLPSLSKVNHVLDSILNAFGPLGHFLDEVDHVLHKKFCLIASIGKVIEGVAKGVEHVGKEVIKGVEHVGKEVIKGVEHVGKEIEHGVKHFVDEAGHVWAEVEDGVEHAAKEVVKGVEHVGKEVIKGVEHVGHEIGKGVEHVGKEVVKGVEHVGHEIGKGVEHVGKEVVKGVEHVGHEIGKGVEHAGKEVVKGVEHVGHEIGKGVEHVGHEISKGIHHIGHTLHHIFGRRDIPEAIYLIDGRIYALMDRHFDSRMRRGFDVCLSVNDVLKGVNFVTGGLMSKAESLINKLFHLKNPFRIPGLTGEVLNIGSLFRHIDLAAVIPSVTDILKLPELDIKKILQLDVKLFEKLVPQCKEAFAKVDMNF